MWRLLHRHSSTLRARSKLSPLEKVISGQLPAGVTDWSEFISLKIEIGVSCMWGYRPGFLDWKANQWATFPSVTYVLCIEYKLYTVMTVGAAVPVMNPIPVVGPQKLVRFDTRRFLGLPV
ncbi:TPA: hypothetical protein N0F65_004843, partial [Lagenidium giganteum]